ncbi:hypothetical protein VTK26DRAFT_9525 [Humicola hyalothermophila]
MNQRASDLLWLAAGRPRSEPYRRHLQCPHRSGEESLRTGRGPSPDLHHPTRTLPSVLTRYLHYLLTFTHIFVITLPGYNKRTRYSHRTFTKHGSTFPGPCNLTPRRGVAVPP